MKITTTKGEGLRQEFTALECAAIKHALNNCTEGKQFTGVPTSSEVRYQKSPAQFRLVSKADGKAVVLYVQTGKELHVNYCEDGEAPKRPSQPKQEKKDIPTPAPAPKAEPTEPVKTASPVDASGALAAFATLFAGVEANVTNKVMEAIRPLIEDMAKNACVRTELTVKVNDKETKVEGITHPKFARVLKYVANHKNVYLYGPAGSGKNVICEQVATALGVPFYYQNTILTKFDVTGYKNAVGDFEETEFFKAWTKGGVFMLDEADNATAEAMVTLNAALANGYYTFPGIGRVACHKDFYCVAAGNTNGQGATEDYCGRYKMDESSRDRFAFVMIDYDAKVEEAIAQGHADVLEFVRELRGITAENRISLICGYRAVKNLVEFYDDQPADIIEDFILKGMEQDAINEIASRMTSANKFSKAFKQLARR